ncbi:hypothetical protein OSB04_013320 [Centaurea solstitialis]|uniref:Uncharacterized protein n=1 Tax=Centaurea solstitialis TaxID=347529 RepID=A0AA38TQZ1_9ASTR|nr:hypothetical protein OSB04_013320 [Centaurea solstitialis]
MCLSSAESADHSMALCSTSKIVGAHLSSWVDWWPRSESSALGIWSKICCIDGNNMRGKVRKLNVSGGCCHNLNVHSISKEYVVARETPLRVKDTLILIFYEKRTSKRFAHLKWKIKNLLEVKDPQVRNIGSKSRPLILVQVPFSSMINFLDLIDENLMKSIRDGLVVATVNVVEVAETATTPLKNARDIWIEIEQQMQRGEKVLESQKENAMSAYEGFRVREHESLTESKPKLNVCGECTKNGCCHNLNVHSILKELVARETPLGVKEIQLFAVRETYPNPSQEVAGSFVDPLPPGGLGNSRKWKEPSDRSEDKNDVFMDPIDLEHDECNKVLKMLPDIIPPSQMDLGSRWGL